MTSPPEPSSPVPLVLHVIPTAVARGAQREARALADRLDAPGIRHHRLMSLFAGPAQVPVDECLGYPNTRPAGAGFDLRLVPRLRRVLTRLCPSVVVAHGGDPLKYLVPALIGRRIPLVYYATGTFARADRWTRVMAWRLLVRRPAVVAAEGEEVLDECRLLLHVPARRLVLAPNGRDPDEFRPAVAADGPEAPAIAFVGALTDGKRPGRFIEVTAALRRRGLVLRALLCGDGPLRPALEGPASRAGVELLGARDDVAALLREADVFLFPSLPTGEGMPGVLIEAGLTGLPAVATDVPGVRTIVGDGLNGFVVDPGDLPAMVDATARLLESPDLRRRMGAAARQRCSSSFSVDAVADCWASFLVPLVTGPDHQRGGR